MITARRYRLHSLGLGGTKGASSASQVACVSVIRSAARIFRTAALMLSLCFLGLPMANAQEASADVYGATRVTLSGGGSFNLISRPYVDAPAWVGAVNGVGSYTLQIGATGSFASSHYIEVTSGAATGVMTDIVSVSGNNLTLADDLSQLLSVGDQVAVRPLPTIDSIFGSDNRYGFTASPNGDPAEADELMVMDARTQQVARYFYSEYPGFVGWFDAATFTPAGDVVLYPENGLVVRVVGSDLQVMFDGQVKQVRASTAVFPGFNVLTNFNPLVAGEGIANDRLFTIGTSGLYTGDESTGIRGSASGNPDEADLVYLLDARAQSTSILFYSNYPGFEGWYDAASFTPANTYTVDGGTSMYVYRRSPTGFNWLQGLNFINN